MGQPVAGSSLDSTRDDSTGSSTDDTAAVSSAGRRPDSAQWAAIVFGLYLVGAGALLLFHFGRDHWFAGDDWGLIIERQLDEPSSWMRPQNGHWLLLPTLVNQVLFRVVGVRSYLPYQAIVVGLHLCLAALCRVVMRRAGVGPWTATLVASAFVLLGGAHEEMLLVIMMGPLLSLVFGFVQLILADHDGDIDRRDWLGLAAGLVALSSSGLGPVMVAVVGLAALARRGWRAALLHTVPLAIVFVLWSAVWGNDPNRSRLSFGVVRRWVQTGWSAVFESLGGYPVVAVLLFALLVTGLFLAWWGLDLATLRRRAAAPAALLCGALIFFVLTSTQRAYIAAPDSSRYIGWSAAMILPALGVAAYGYIQRWRVTAPFIVLLFLIGVPRSIDDLSTNAGERADLGQRVKLSLLAAVRSPAFDDVPNDVHPDPNQHRAAEVTVGFLRAADAKGRLPSVSDSEVPRQLVSQAATRLRLAQSALGEPMPDDLECKKHDAPLVIDARQGDQFGLVSDVRITPLGDDGEPAGAPTPYSVAWSGSVLTLEVPQLNFRVEGLARGRFEFCTA